MKAQMNAAKKALVASAMAGLLIISFLVPKFLSGPNKASHLSPKTTAVQISFLKDGPVLKNTVQLLEKHGIKQDSLALFQNAVANYNTTPPNIKLEKFPKLQNGFYSFDSTSRLVNALPHKLCDTEHAYAMNCFDTMFILLKDFFETGLRTDDTFVSFLVPHYMTNGEFNIVQAGTPGMAFSLVYPDWYRETTDGFFPKPLADSRVCFTACFFRMHQLPEAVTEVNLGRGVLEVLRSDWKAHALKFPPAMEVVLCHDVNFPGHIFSTSHMGLLLPAQNHYVYLEKAGGKGPFIRLDLADKADLSKWLAKTFTGPEARKLGYTHHFVTFNNTSIETLEEEE